MVEVDHDDTSKELNHENEHEVDIFHQQYDSPTKKKLVELIKKQKNQKQEAEIESLYLLFGVFFMVSNVTFIIPLPFQTNFYIENTKN